MLNISDKKFFYEIVADSVAQAHLTFRRKKNLRNRWIKAIAKAAAVILEGDNTFLHWDPQGVTLLFWSAESNEIYSISDQGGCQCPAFNQNRPPLPCHHRAMSRLIKNYFELQLKPGEISQIDFAEAVFFDSELAVARKLELLNLCVSEGRSDLSAHLEALQKPIARGGK